jgi:hypothetical protein
MSKTTIASFVLRFTQELTPDKQRVRPWRAVIRHVQSNEEAHFTEMDEALDFIGHYVDLSGEASRATEGHQVEQEGLPTT